MKTYMREKVKKIEYMKTKVRKSKMKMETQM